MLYRQLFTDVYTRTPTRPGKVRLRTYAAMGETSTNHEAHRSDASRGTLLMAVSCNWRASVGLHACYVHLDGERSSSARDRCTDPRPPLTTREGGNDIIPWWMLHPSGIANISRDTTTSTRRHVDPRRPRNDTTQCAPAYIRVDVVCRVAFTPRGTTGLRRSIPFEKASTWEWSVADWCGLWLTWLGELVMWMFFKFIASKINYDFFKSWYWKFFFINWNISI